MISIFGCRIFCVVTLVLVPISILAKPPIKSSHNKNTRTTDPELVPIFPPPPQEEDSKSQAPKPEVKGDGQASPTPAPPLTDQLAPAPNLPPPAAPLVPPKPTTVPKESIERESPVISPKKKPREEPNQPLFYAGATTCGLGWALIGLGSYYGIQSSRTRKSIDYNGEMTQLEAYSRGRKANDQTTVANVFFLAGGLVTISGIGMLFFDHFASTQTPQISLQWKDSTWQLVLQF